MNQQVLLKSSEERLSHLVSKAFEIAGSPISEEKLDKWDVGELVMPYDKKVEFYKYASYYFMSNKCMFPIFELETAENFDPYDKGVRALASNILLDAIIEASKQKQ